MELKPLTCDKCGGQIDRVTLTCKMCGTQYVLDENMRPVRLEVSECRLVTIGSSIAVPSYSLSAHPEECSELVLKELASKMAEKLLPLMEFQSTYDMQYNQYVTYARLRVAEPKVRIPYDLVAGEWRTNDVIR